MDGCEFQTSGKMVVGPGWEILPQVVTWGLGTPTPTHLGPTPLLRHTFGDISGPGGPAGSCPIRRFQDGNPQLG